MNKTWTRLFAGLVSSCAISTLSASYLPASAQYMTSDASYLPTSTRQTTQYPVSLGVEADRSKIPSSDGAASDFAVKGSSVNFVNFDCINSANSVVTTGTVQVNMLANLESLLNTGTDGAELVGFIWATILFTSAIRLKCQAAMGAMRTACLGVLILTLSLFVPQAVNWLVASARDANLFN